MYNVGLGFFTAVLISLTVYQLVAFYYKSKVYRLANEKQDIATNERVDGERFPAKSSGAVKDNPVRKKPQVEASASFLLKEKMPIKRGSKNQLLQHDRQERMIKLISGIFFSVLIVVSCIYIVLTSPNQETIKWAQSTIALILGVWIKSIN